MLEISNHYIPIEVKWTASPSLKDARHLQKFLAEYDNADKAYILCQTPHAIELSENIIALPWQELKKIVVRA